MIIALTLISLFDSAFIPLNRPLSAVLIVAIAIIGFWKLVGFKPWYRLAFIFISLALLGYLFGSPTTRQVVVHKLSDWSYLFLILGTLKLLFSLKAKHGAKSD